jgi:hypothetical protein
MKLASQSWLPLAQLPLINHLLRMKKSIKAMDNAWFGTNKAIVVNILSNIALIFRFQKYIFVFL